VAEDTDKKIDLGFLPMEIDKAVGSEISMSDFKLGLKVGSMYAGIATALFNSGLKEDSVKEIICSHIKTN